MQKKGFKLAGYTVRTTNQNGQAMQDIGTLWAKVLGAQLLEKIPHKISNEVFALYYDYAGDYTQPYTCLIGVPVSDTDRLPAGITGVLIPAQNYQVITAKGKMPDALIQTWQKIWQSNLNRNYRFDFEAYGETSFSENPEVQIWIGLQNEI